MALANGFYPWLVLQARCLFGLWWESLSSGIPLRSPSPSYRAEHKAFILSLLGRRLGLTTRDLEGRLRFVLRPCDKGQECPRDYILVFFVDKYLAGARSVPHAPGQPPSLAAQAEVEALLEERYGIYRKKGADCYTKLYFM